MKIRTVGTKLLHADGRTDVTNLIVTSRNFSKAPKMVLKKRRGQKIAYNKLKLLTQLSCTVVLCKNVVFVINI